MSTQAERSQVKIGHVTEPTWCYPGESVVLHTRVESSQPLHACSLCIVLPPGLAPQEITGFNHSPARVTTNGTVSRVVWDDGPLLLEGVHDCAISVVATGSTEDDCSTLARIDYTDRDGVRRSAQETAVFQLVRSAAMLRYLPALYQHDDMISRLLMLFESFWRPIEERIDQMALYLDPLLAPDAMLPWLASWLGQSIGEWPAGLDRELVQAGASMWNQRGTPAGLRQHLAMIGEQAQIVERGTGGFWLGPDNLLGPLAQLGLQGPDQAFEVVLEPLSDVDDESDQARARRAATRMDRISAVVESHRPAHASCVIRDQEPALTTRHEDTP